MKTNRINWDNVKKKLKDMSFRIKDMSHNEENSKKILKKRANLLARRTAKEQTKSIKKNYLLVLLEEKKYALPMELISEIKKIKKYTPVPGVPEHIKGIMNHNEEFYVVIQLKRLLDLKEENCKTREKYYIALKNKPICFIVDAIEKITNIDEKTVTEQGSRSTDILSKYIQTTFQGEFYLINIEKIINTVTISKTGGIQ